MILPPGITDAEFVRFLKSAADIVGAEWVITGDDVTPYGRVMLPFPEDAHMPSAAICPQSLDQVQQLLKLANAARVPLWPTSTGRNLGYGGSSVAERGTVVLDLRRMNRILDFDSALGSVVVEPGVTYQQLQDFLKTGNHPFWIDFPGPGPIVSPMGNTLERGHGLSPYGDHFANSCGFEVVLADGTLFRTGMGGVAGTRSWQAFRYGYGPTLDGIFTQSNFGVVTKMGIWLLPAPPAHRTILAHWPNHEDIGRLVDAVRPLRMDGTIGNEGILGNANIFCIATRRRADFYQGKGSLPRELAIAEARKAGLGAWNYVFSLYGRPDQVESNWREVKMRLEDSGASLIPDVKDEQQVNELTLKSFSLLNWIGGGGLAWFSPVAPMIGAEVRRQMDIAGEITARFNIDFACGAGFGNREVLNVMPLLYDRDEPGRVEQVRACFMALIDGFGAAGFGMYRTGVGFMDRVAELHGEVNLEVNRRIKRALDPHGILAPGKSGIRI